MSIRSRLVLLVFAVLVPAVLASLLGMVYVYKERERSVERSLLEMSRALALVVDREIERREAFLAMLASSPAFTRNDLEMFGETMAAAAKASASSVYLYDLEGQPLLGSEGFEEAAIPPTALNKAQWTEAGALVSNTYVTSRGVPSFAIIRQVEVKDEARYRLAMVAPIGQFQDVLAELNLPPGWTGVILDREGIIVARNKNPHIHVGTYANPDILKHLESNRGGFFSTVTRDGSPSLAAFNKAPSSGWFFIAAIPEEDVNKSAADALRLLAIVAVLLLAAGMVLAVRMGRAVVKPMRLLTAQAESLGRGEEVTPTQTGLREIDVVSAAMVTASSQVREANLTMERRIVEAVAESERSQQALLQSQKLEALGRLTGGIAHDFNNLLQTLSTGLHLTDLLTDHPKAKTALDSCKRAVGRASKLTRQLMAFGKSRVSEAKRIDVRNQLLAMEDLLKGALRSDIDLRLDLAEDLWPAHMDPLQFELAILNLAINTRDATSGIGSVFISAVNAPLQQGEVADLGEGDYVKLAFRDSGEGMPPEVLEKALDPFFTTKAAGKGSGLGLAQVYGFMKQSRGGVTLESKQGEGTTVTLYLPRSFADTIAEEPPTADYGSSSDRTATVLVVEDDVLVRDVVGPALSAHGFNVLTAGDADEAVEMLALHAVDVVFSDIVMPGSMNGVKLAETIRLTHPDIPVILATGYSEEASIPDEIRTITKPYEISSVVRALREALTCYEKAGGAW